jgi:predicted DNA-binding transcriptional regulator AlpA
MRDMITGRELGLKALRGRAISTKEISALLRVSERWVESHMSDGTFPFAWFPISPKNRVADSADIDAWLHGIKVQAGTAPLPKKAIKQIKKKEVKAE